MVSRLLSLSPRAALTLTQQCWDQLILLASLYSVSGTPHCLNFLPTSLNVASLSPLLVSPPLANVLKSIVVFSVVFILTPMEIPSSSWALNTIYMPMTGKDISPGQTSLLLMNTSICWLCISKWGSNRHSKLKTWSTCSQTCSVLHLNSWQLHLCTTQKTLSSLWDLPLSHTWYPVWRGILLAGPAKCIQNSITSRHLCCYK